MMRPPFGLWFSVDASTTASYLLERPKLQTTDPFNPDVDGDGLKDGEEVKLHQTDPFKTDTDGDGVFDGDEVRIWKTNPRIGDTDGDGLSDSQEVFNYRTNPNRADTDGDGLLDLDEVVGYRTDPSLSDTDGDGFDDSTEIRFGSDPLDPAQYPGVHARAFRMQEIVFDTQVGMRYQLQTLNSNRVWINEGPVIQATGASLSRSVSGRGRLGKAVRVVFVP